MSPGLTPSASPAGVVIRTQLAAIDAALASRPPEAGPAQAGNAVRIDLREPEAILSHPKTGTLIDFSQPVGVLLVAILHFITAAEEGTGQGRRLRSGPSRRRVGVVGWP